ncbi:TonB-dependent receptor [Nitrincola iocasae]|uniref:TonB-dependent receptor n=2 Tax=Nitrincola iocasae TaxID=2614693 RepID=A0A5J6LCL7_9GAMM|nr:TonB-dependent receptor [Nitrincola iocasae]
MRIISSCKKSVLYLAVLAASSSVHAASTQSTSSAIVLESILIKADSTDETPINNELLQERVIFDMKNVFRLKPEITLGGGSRNAQRVYLNGVEGSNLNITIDGARNGRNLHQHRGGFGGLNPDLLKQVDIHSTSGVTSGPGALGGSIHMTSVDAQDLLQRSGKVDGIGARIKTGYSSVDNGKHGNISLYGMASDQLGLLAHISADNRGDYETGSGRSVIGSAGQDRDYLFKLSLLDAGNHSVRAAVSRNHNEGLYARGSHGSDMGYLPELQTGPSSRVRQETEQDRMTLEYHWNPANNAADFRANLYRTENTLRYPGSAIEDIRTEEIGLSINNTSHFNFTSLDTALTLGMDWFEETAYTNALNMGNTLVWPDLTGQAVEYKSENLGIYMESITDFGPLTTTVGLRLDHYDSDYGPIQLKGSKVSPALRFDYALTNEFNLFAGYSEAARGSGIIPVGFLGRLNQTTTAANNQLKAETSKQHEIGIRYVSENWPLTLHLKAFDTRLDNNIQTIGQGSAPLGTAGIFNSDRLDIEGWQFNAEWTAGFYSTNFALNIIDVNYNQFPSGGIRRMTAPTGDSLVWDNRWQLSEQWLVGYTLELVADLEDVPAGEPERDGYHIHSLRTQWKPNPDLEFGLAIDNLFNKRYANHTSLYSAVTGIVDEPGRDIRLSLTYTF